MSLSENALKKNNETKRELFKLAQIFVFLYAIVFIYISGQPLRIGSAGSVEQWLNVLPDFFSDSQDFLFSYGPLYWLTGQTVVQHSQLTYWLSVFFITTYCALMWSLLLRVAIRHKVVFLLAIIYVVILKNFNVASVFFTFPLFLIVYFKSINDERWLDNGYVLFALAIITSFLFYVRFFYGLVAFLTFASYIFSKIFFQKKYPPIVIFSISSVLLYIILGYFIFHDLGSIRNYTVINSQLSFGNSVDMSYDVSIKNAAWIVIFFSFVSFNYFLIKACPSLLLTVNGLFLIFLKLGFSRADHYIGYFLAPIALMALICSVSINHRWRLLSAFIVVLMIVLGTISIYPNVRTLTWFKNYENFNISSVDRAAESYPQFKLPKDLLAKISNSTIDIYPYQNEYLLSNKLNYVHRPSFQNYMTLTPVLDKMNVNFFSSKNAPEYILWHGPIGCRDSSCLFYDDFDSKYSLNEDPLTSTVILTNYHQAGSFVDISKRPVLLMKKNESFKEVIPKKLESLSMHFGEWVKVPNLTDGVVKLKPEFNFTLLAKIKNMLYRGGVLYVNYKLESGDVKRYRLNIINSQSGIWVSPWLDAFPQRGQRVVELMIETPSKFYFKDEFKANWVMYPIQNFEVYKPTYPEFSSVKPNPLNELSTACDASIDTIDISIFNVDGIMKKRLSSSGWTALSIEKNLPSEKAWLSLTDEVGQRVYLPLDAYPRHDVAKHFNKSALENSGYKIVADITDLKGNYNLGLAISGDGKLLQCSNFKKPVIIH